jgi:predicted dinucleotide-binding enzyme
MSNPFYLLSLMAVLAACEGKNNTVPPSNTVSLSASVTNETVPGPSGPQKVWRPMVSVSQAMTDTAFVAIRWEQFNAANVSQGQLNDTVVVDPGNSGVVGKTSNSPYTDTWTAKNVTIMNAWNKPPGKYVFQY